MFSPISTYPCGKSNVVDESKYVRRHQVEKREERLWQNKDECVNVRYRQPFKSGKYIILEQSN